MVCGVDGIEDWLKHSSGGSLGESGERPAALFSFRRAVGLQGIYAPHPDPIVASLYKRSFLKPSFGHWTSFRARD
jgi:hypothetical protein